VLLLLPAPQPLTLLPPPNNCLRCWHSNLTRDSSSWDFISASLLCSFSSLRSLSALSARRLWRSISCLSRKTSSQRMCVWRVCCMMRSRISSWEEVVWVAMRRPSASCVRKELLRCVVLSTLGYWHLRRYRPFSQTGDYLRRASLRRRCRSHAFSFLGKCLPHGSLPPIGVGTTHFPLSENAPRTFRCLIGRIRIKSPYIKGTE